MLKCKVFLFALCHRNGRHPCASTTPRLRSYAGKALPLQNFFSRRYIAQAEIGGEESIPRDHVPPHTVARFWIATAGQNASLTPNWISRFGLAAVKPSGWLGERLAVPCTLNGGANCEPTMLFTLA